MKLKSKVLTASLSILLMMSTVSFAAETNDNVLPAGKNRIIKRISGNDRFDTAVQISSNFSPNASKVIIANGYGFADALAGGQLSIFMNAPILLTKGDRLNSNVASLLKNMTLDKIVILGGTNSISSNVEKQLNSYAKVERIAGNDRYDTSRKIMEKAKTYTANDNVVVVSGKSFPDALSAAGYVAESKALMLLSNGKTLGVDEDKAIVIGGESTLPLRGYKVARIAGNDRYETSDIVANTLKNAGKKAVLANGRNYPDALASALICGIYKAPLLLTNTDSMSPLVMKTLRSNAAEIFAVGGPNSISKELLKSIDPNAEIRDSYASVPTDNDKANVPEQNGVAPTAEEIKNAEIKYVDPSNVNPASDFEFNEKDQMITAYKGSSKNVVIPQKINGIMVRNIGPDSFVGKEIKSLVLPEGVWQIMNSAFANNRIQSIKIPLSMKIIGFGAFNSNALQSLVIPGSVEKIGTIAFSQNYISYLKLGYGIKELGENAFSINKIEKVVVPNSVVTIGAEVFKKNNITEIHLPVGIREIPAHMFSFNSLTKVVIPDSVQRIEKYAFGYNNGLTEVIIPSSVKFIGQGAFSGDPIKKVSVDKNAVIAGDAFSEDTEIVKY